MYVLRDSTFLGRQEGQYSAITMRSRLAKPIGMRMCSAEYHGKDIVVVDEASQNTMSLCAVYEERVLRVSIPVGLYRNDVRW